MSDIRKFWSCLLSHVDIKILRPVQPVCDTRKSLSATLEVFVSRYRIALFEMIVVHFVSKVSFFFSSKLLVIVVILLIGLCLIFRGIWDISLIQCKPLLISTGNLSYYIIPISITPSVSRPKLLEMYFVHDDVIIV